MDGVDLLSSCFFHTVFDISLGLHTCAYMFQHAAQLFSWSTAEIARCHEIMKGRILQPVLHISWRKSPSFRELMKLVTCGGTDLKLALVARVQGYIDWYLLYTRRALRELIPRPTSFSEDKKNASNFLYHYVFSSSIYLYTLLQGLGYDLWIHHIYIYIVPAFISYSDELHPRSC